MIGMMVMRSSKNLRPVGVGITPFRERLKIANPNSDSNSLSDSESACWEMNSFFAACVIEPSSAMICAYWNCLICKTITSGIVYHFD